MKYQTTIVLLSLFTFLSAQDYFQQEVHYNIQVSLDDEKHELSGFETIKYINYSSDVLEYLYFHLWPNAYSNNNTALAGQKIYTGGKHKLFTLDVQRGFIDSIDFRVNNNPVRWEYDPEHIDICKLFLEKPLQPGESIEISTPFHVKIPLSITSRLGHKDQGYYITQWYPKPAVYDQYGWHPMPYLDMGEFYSEFGSFDVSITLPANYIVAATGDLQTESEIKWIEERLIDTTLIDSLKKDIPEPESSEELKTIRFTQNNVHDFAWFADKTFQVMKSSVQLPSSGRTVNSWAYFRASEVELWKEATTYINDAIYYLSKWYGEYPYNNCSAVLARSGAGGGGMEYPNITLIGNFKNPYMLEKVIMHEVCHNWFYGILGFDERKYPYLDEGLTTFSEIRYTETKYQGHKLYEEVMKEGMAKLIGIHELPYRYMHKGQYMISARLGEDQPTNTPSSEFPPLNYGTIAYSKAGMCYYHLWAYLGEERFNKVMQKFYRDWEFKHPYPEDLRDCFEEETGEDLSWVFNELLETDDVLDYKASAIKDSKLFVKNSGNINSPFRVTGIKDGKEVFSAWYPPIESKKWIDLPDNSSDKVYIDYGQETIDLYPRNNKIRTSGILKKAEFPKIKPIGALADDEKKSLYLFPAVGYNYYNGMLLGIGFYNALLPKENLSYQLVPMFGIMNKGFAGLGNISYQILPNLQTLHKIEFSVSGKRFAYDRSSADAFNRIGIKADVYLAKRDALSKALNYFSVEGIIADNIMGLFEENFEGTDYFQRLSFNHSNKRSINPYSFSVNTEFTEDFGKASVEFNYKISYYKKRGLDIRFFGGTFLYTDSDLPEFYDFKLSGTTGVDDYTYDHLYFGRFEDINNMDNPKLLTRQFVKNEGGFVGYSYAGRTDKWLLGLNLSSSMPFNSPIPVKVYQNFALLDDTREITDFDKLEKFMFEGGIELPVFKGIINIYFPIYYSSRLNDYMNEIGNNYWEKIRYTIDLNKLNVFKILDTTYNLF